MKLSALLDETAAGAEPALLDREVIALTAASRLVQRGFLFAAVPGSKTDGTAFIADALAKGAVAVLTTPAAPGSGPLLRDPTPRRRLALMAARFHGAPPATVVAVTGTSGK